MNKKPSFKIATSVVSLYILFLFIPTIDVAATYQINLFTFSLPISVAGLIFPAIYPLSDSVTEVYGKEVSYNMVIICYIAAVAFSFINTFLLSLSLNHVLYSFMIRSSLLLTIVGPVGYFVTSVFNIKVLNKLKIKMRGRHFIIRSLVCSAMSEVIISTIIYPALFYPKGIKYVLLISLGTCIVKILLTVPMVFVAKFLVTLYRYVDDIEYAPYNQSLAEYISVKS